jgi:hypothetical protein
MTKEDTIQQIVSKYPFFVTLRKQKSKATFKILTRIRFVALFSNMMDRIVALD